METAFDVLVAISKALLHSLGAFLEPLGAAFPWARLMPKQGDQQTCTALMTAFLNCILERRNHERPESQQH